MQPQKIPLIMAPLAGITDSVFRRIVKQFGADIVYTEMVSAKGLYYGDKKTRLLLRSTEAVSYTHLDVYKRQLLLCSYSFLT